MIPRMASVVISLIAPTVIVTVGILVLGGSSVTVFGIPLVLLFMFVMFPVMSLAMWISWHLFDKHADYQLDELEDPVSEVSS
ncbi:hypothetical protein [Rothia uropygialis]|uniref:hypothetical protein n=1 Tax=Kocuria sp. 36 TaxID=1415402 RepID=UPI00101BE990|nr:hypothetical protein [Kocuria sp. 36]